MDNHRFLGLIERSVQSHWEMPAFSDFKGATYLFKDVACHIEKFHILLAEAGIKPGDKIALIGRNSSNWAICFFGILTYGAVAVPILHDFKPDIIHHIVNHSEATAIMVSTSNWESLDEQKMPAVRLISCLDDLSLICSSVETSRLAKERIEELFTQKYPHGLNPDSIHYHIEQPEELAVLNYTSGTTSLSKGVMIPYRSLWSNTQFAYDHLPFIQAGDNIVCMLPMAHMYGLAFEVLNSVNKGCHIHFITRTPVPKLISEAFATVKPRLILAVPLIIEKIIRGKIMPELEKPLMRFLMKLPIVNNRILRIISQKMETAFGGNFAEIIIGGAAFSKEVEQLLHRLHFRYTVGYGMTECGPLISYAHWNVFKVGSVGRVVDRMEIRIDSADPERQVGEILVKGSNVMLGYYKNQEATSAVMMENGWMRTGDLGTIDRDGFLYIRGRCKTMILGSNGQNIYPEEIEDRLNQMPYVAESLIVMQGHKLNALIHPNWEEIDRTNIDHSEIGKIMQANIDQLNKEIPGHCHISGLKLYQEEFEKTPKRSIKRYLYQQAEER